MNIGIKQVQNDDELATMLALLTLCGEHMHRVQGMSHWYPFGSFERFKERVADGKVYAVYEKEFLVGTFFLSEKMPHYYAEIQWENPEAKAVFGSSFGILPVMQKRGIGAWVMQAIDKQVADEGYQALRFDAVSHNKSLVAYYERLGYERRGIVGDSRVSAICFEKVF